MLSALHDTELTTLRLKFSTLKSRNLYPRSPMGGVAAELSRKTFFKKDDRRNRTRTEKQFELGCLKIGQLFPLIVST